MVMPMVYNFLCFALVSERCLPGYHAISFTFHLHLTLKKNKHNQTYSGWCVASLCAQENNSFKY